MRDFLDLLAFIFLSILLWVIAVVSYPLILLLDWRDERRRRSTGRGA